MSLHHVIRTGSGPAERPMILWGIIIEVPVAPTTTPEEMDFVRRDLVERFEVQIAEALGSLADAEVCGIDVFDLRGLDAGPSFPIVAGETTFTIVEDVKEMVGLLSQGTDLARIAYDPHGKAFEIDVEVGFIPRPDFDGQNHAPMPDPDQVARIEQERATAPLPTSWFRRQIPIPPAKGKQSRGRRKRGG